MKNAFIYSSSKSTRLIAKSITPLSFGKASLDGAFATLFKGINVVLPALADFNSSIATDATCSSSTTIQTVLKKLVLLPMTIYITLVLTIWSLFMSQRVIVSLESYLLSLGRTWCLSIVQVGLWWWNLLFREVLSILKQILKHLKNKHLI